MCSGSLEEMNHLLDLLGDDLSHLSSLNRQQRSSAMALEMATLNLLATSLKRLGAVAFWGDLRSLRVDTRPNRRVVFLALLLAFARRNRGGQIPSSFIATPIFPGLKVHCLAVSTDNNTFYFYIQENQDAEKKLRDKDVYEAVVSILNQELTDFEVGYLRFLT